MLLEIMNRSRLDLFRKLIWYSMQIVPLHIWHFQKAFFDEFICHCLYVVWDNSGGSLFFTSIITCLKFNLSVPVKWDSFFLDAASNLPLWPYVDHGRFHWFAYCHHHIILVSRFLQPDKFGTFI